MTDFDREALEIAKEVWTGVGPYNRYLLEFARRLRDKWQARMELKAWQVWTPFGGPARFSTDPRTPLQNRADYVVTPLYALPQPEQNAAGQHEPNSRSASNSKPEPLQSSVAAPAAPGVVVPREAISIRDEICKIVSRMLDNPDECGIYPTTRCYDELETLINSVRVK